MGPANRVVVQTPLQHLWSEDGTIPSTRIGSVNTEDIRELLRLGPVRFVIADVGLPLKWISAQDSRTFWKAEVRCHLSNADVFYLRDFPGEYAYTAARWLGEPPIIVLEKHH